MNGSSAGHPSLLHQVLARLFLAVLAAAVAATVVYVVVRPIELEYEFEALAREFGKRLVEVGRRDGQRVLELRMDGRLYAWLQEIPDLHLRIWDPQRRAVLFSYDHDRATAEVITPLLSWPPGLFELHEQAEAELEYGFVERLPVGDGRELRLVIRRGPPVWRDYLYWIGVEFGYEILPAFLAIVTAGSLAAAAGVARALAPIRRLSRLAAALDPTRGHELPTRGVPVEILPLVEAVNRMLVRLRAVLDRQRRFTAFAAHELRTPLAALRARVEGLPADLPERAPLLRTIERTERLVDSLLALARIGAGLAAPDEEVDLRRIVAEAAEDFAPAALDRDVHFEVELPERPVPARVHRDSLVRAIGNLLDNALKYGGDGGRIVLSLAPDGRILVRDHGPGLPDGDPDLLFEPFVRMRPGRGDPGGAGLGLAFVREVAELHGGEVIARNAEGGGAVVGLRIPVHEAPNA